MFVYGLTGGIGSGKSTVARFFIQAGVPAYDADQLAHELLAADGSEARVVGQRFADCVRVDGSIDRSRLAERVFQDATQRRWLEDRLHPAIQRSLHDRLRRLPRPRPEVVLVEGAVLPESRTRFDLAGMIVVVAARDVRVERLRLRNDMSQKAIENRRRAQMPEHQKILFASHVIDNSGPLERTRRQVLAVRDQLFQEIGGIR